MGRFSLSDLAQLIGQYTDLIEEIEYLDNLNYNNIEHQRASARKWELLAELEPKLDEKLSKEFKDVRYYRGFYDSRDPDTDEYDYTVDDLDRNLKGFLRELSKIPEDVSEEKAQRIYRKWRQLLDEYIFLASDELKRRGVSVQPPKQEKDDEKSEADEIERVREHVRKMIEAEQKLMQDCEEEVAKYPEQETQIRRIYRRAIDRLKEQQ